MRTNLPTSAAIPLICLAMLALAGPAIAQRAQTPAPCCPPAGTHALSDAPLNEQQVRDLVARVLENQHQNDLAIAEYELTQKIFVRGNGKDEADKRVTNRVIPAGGTLVRVELERNGKAADHAAMDQQWRAAEKALVAVARGDTSFFKRDTERGAAQKRDRADMVATMGKAFLFHWQGREVIQNIATVRLGFEPNPTYSSSSRYAPLYAHSHGTVWIAEASAQLMRLDAELTDDVYFGAGVIAKVYRGSRFTFEQVEVAPGLWLPAQHTYDFDGRKFLFAMNIHEKTEYSQYRRIGPPQEALLLIRSERGAGSKSAP
jgi:hypothetical protein